MRLLLLPLPLPPLPLPLLPLLLLPLPLLLLWLLLSLLLFWPLCPEDEEAWLEGRDGGCQLVPKNKSSTTSIAFTESLDGGCAAPAALLLFF